MRDGVSRWRCHPLPFELQTYFYCAVREGAPGTYGNPSLGKFISPPFMLAAWFSRRPLGGWGGRVRHGRDTATFAFYSVACVRPAPRFEFMAPLFRVPVVGEVHIPCLLFDPGAHVACVVP